MDFWKTLLVLLKRWYVALPVFAVSLGLAGGVYATMPMHYESTGVIVLTSPSSGPTSTQNKETGQTNPLLAFESSLAISAAIVIQSVGTPEVAKALGADTPDRSYTISGGELGGPFIIVKGDSTSEEGSREVVVQVLDRVKQELTSRQEALNAPKSTHIGVDPVVPPTKPEPQRGGKLRSAAVALVLGLIASLAAVFGVESFQSRKRKRAGDSDSDAAEAETDSDSDVEPDDTEPVKPAAKPVEPEPRTPPVQRTAPPVNGRPNGRPAELPKPAGQPGRQPANGKPTPATSGQGAAGSLWPTEEWRGDPPTVRMKPAGPPIKPAGPPIKPPEKRP